MASESESKDSIIQTLMQIANNCILDEIKISKLPLVDLEYLFLNLRARSVNENVDAFFKCRNLVEEKECGMVIDMSVDLLKEVNIINSEKPNKIMLTDKVGVLMKYPSINQLDVSDTDTEKDLEIKLVVDCLDKIFDSDSVISCESASEEELYEFVSNLSNPDYDKLLDYVKTVPTIQYKNKQTCPKCGFVHDVKLEGINDFFI
jgi:DNA-directed RNA polymerase subunit M/transcription elongation factor TFIIS